GGRGRVSGSQPSLAAGLARDLPVGRRDLVEDYPDGLSGQLAHVGDRVRHPARDFVLAILAVSLVDRDVDERHAQTSVGDDVGKSGDKVPREGGSDNTRTRRLVLLQRRSDRAEQLDVFERLDEVGGGADLSGALPMTGV